MDTKKIPAIVMLLAGTVACIVTYINHYDLKDMLVVLILTLVIFLIIGIVIKMILDSFDLPEEEKNEVGDEGEVVEKNPEMSEEEINETAGNDLNNENADNEGAL